MAVVVGAVVLAGCSNADETPARVDTTSRETMSGAPEATLSTDEPTQASVPPLSVEEESPDDRRSERIGQVDIAAELMPDGSLRLMENREFVYTGSFQGAFYELPLSGGQQVTLNEVTDDRGVAYRPGECSPDGTKDPGAYSVEADRDRFVVIWCWDPLPTDTSRAITLDYTVSRAGVRHEDSSELYWQFVGDGWDVSSASVVANVRLPTSQVQFWAHGPLTGTVDEVKPGMVRLEVADLPPNTFVELRALMPAGALAQAPSDGRAVRQQILDEEACLATAANAERARARGEQPQEDCDPTSTEGS